MNKVILIGNLCRDPELRYTPTGKAVTDITVACNRKYTGSDGEKKEEVAFVDCTFWTRRAEVIAEYFRKGDQIAVSGRLVTERWEGEGGMKRSRTKVTGEEFNFCGPTKGNQGSSEDSFTPGGVTPPDSDWRLPPTDEVPF